LDGVSFGATAPKADNGRSHIGMEKPRIRLKEMCAGWTAAGNLKNREQKNSLSKCKGKD